MNRKLFMFIRVSISVLIAWLLVVSVAITPLAVYADGTVENPGENEESLAENPGESAEELSETAENPGETVENPGENAIEDSTRGSATDESAVENSSREDPVEDPVEEPTVLLTGLYEKDGKYYYYIDSVLQEKYTGLYLHDGKYYYLSKGIWQDKYIGLYEHSKNGKFYYLKDGIWQSDYIGLYKHSVNGNLYYMKNGLWQKGYIGLYENPESGEFYHLNNGVWNKNYTGLYEHSKNGKFYYLKGGIWQSGYIGLYKHSVNGKLYYLRNGLWQKGYAGLYENSEDGKFYYLINGVCNKNYTGLYEHSINKKYYYIENGIWRKKYTGPAYDDKATKYVHVAGGLTSTESGKFKNSKVNNYTYTKGIITGIASPYGKHLYVTGGKPGKAQIVTVGGEYYKVGIGGALQSGWSTDNEKERYYDPDTFKAVRDKVIDKLYVNDNAEVTNAAKQASVLLDEIGWDLKNAYAWCRDISYERQYGDISVRGTTSLAEYCFTNKKGNCYIKSAGFWYLAKTLDYPGLINKAGYMNDQRHGWCEVVEDGVTYVFDPTMDDTEHSWTQSDGWASYHVVKGSSKILTFNPGDKIVPLDV